MNIVAINNRLDSTRISPHKVQLTALNRGYNVGVRYPDLGGYNVPFTAFLNSAIDLRLVNKLVVAYHNIALELDPLRQQPLPHTYDYDYANFASWVIRRDGQACSVLPNTFWADEPRFAFNHGG